MNKEYTYRLQQLDPLGDVENEVYVAFDKELSTKDLIRFQDILSNLSRIDDETGTTIIVFNGLHALERQTGIKGHLVNISLSGTIKF